MRNTKKLKNACENFGLSVQWPLGWFFVLVCHFVFGFCCLFLFIVCMFWLCLVCCIFFVCFCCIIVLFNLSDNFVLSWPVRLERFNGRSKIKKFKV